jgi:cobalt-zinc-cadmium efflux system protein
MVIVVIVIIVEAIERMNNPAPVAGGMVMVVASIGLLVNISVGWVLSRGEQTLNIRAAVIHVMGDLLGSVAALISGAVIYFKQWTLIDPILSIFVSLLILFSSLQLLRESLIVLMEGVPAHIDLNQVAKGMTKVAKVIAVHDLHIWTLSSGKIMLSAHVEVDDLNDWPPALRTLRHLLDADFGIQHVTLQPESRVERIQHMTYTPGCNTQNC